LSADDYCDHTSVQAIAAALLLLLLIMMTKPVHVTELNMMTETITT